MYRETDQITYSALSVNGWFAGAEEHKTADLRSDEIAPRIMLWVEARAAWTRRLSSWLGRSHLDLKPS